RDPAARLSCSSSEGRAAREQRHPPRHLRNSPALRGGAGRDEGDEGDCMDGVVPRVFARFREGLRSGNCMRDGARRGNFIPSISLPILLWAPVQVIPGMLAGSAYRRAGASARPTEEMLSPVAMTHHVICTRSLAG